MSPMCKQMTREPYRSVAHAATAEEVVAEADSPTPSLTPPGTPSPPPLVADSPPLVAAAARPHENLLEGEKEDASRRRLGHPLLQDPSNDCLPIDHNLPQMLRQVTGQSNLRSVRELRLRVISREMSLQRLSVFTPNLREMNLDGSCLTSLRDLGCALGSLHVLRVARCGLDSLDGVLSLGNLRELHASENQIDDIAPCSCLPHIRIIDLRKNTLSDISYLQFLDTCTHLEGLILAECPAASAPTYRSDVRRMLPHLMYLDQTPLSPRAVQGNPSFRRSNVDNVADDSSEHESVFSKVADSEPKKEHSLPARHTEQPDKPTTANEKTPTTRTVRFSIPEDAPAPSNSQMKSASATEVPSLGATQKRPASSRRSASPYTTQRNPRPLSASATESGTRCDSPSALTSGMVVCGNLTAALRNRRKRSEAWGVESREQSQEEQRSVEEVAMASGEAPESHQSSSNAMEESEEDLLKISRKWRQEYKLYRDERRDRWKKEAEEEEEGECDEVTSVSKRGSKTTCCPHLFAPKKEETSVNNKRPPRVPPKR